MEPSKSSAFLFDMGTTSSPVRPGFQPVTVKDRFSPGKAFGWESTEGLRDQHQAYLDWLDNPSRGTKQPPPIYTNEITEDAIAAMTPNVLHVTAPRGKYVVHTISGLSEGNPNQVIDFDIIIGDEETQIQIPGPHRFEHRSFRTEVAEDAIDIHLRPRNLWAMNAVLIFPAAEADALSKTILDPLLEEIYFLPPAVASQWKETTRRDPTPFPELTRREKERGYLLHRRHYLEVVYPDTVPKPDGFDGELSIFASLGEYEPATFCIYPIRDLAGCSITASDLHGPDTIPSTEIDVRKVRYVRARPNYCDYFSYHTVPDILDRYVPEDLEADMNHRFWLTVHVPEDIKSGAYEGTVTFQSANAQEAKIRLLLTVLPIRLREDPDKMYAIYYHNPLGNARNAPDEISRRYWLRKVEAELADMKAHGTKNFTTGLSSPPADENGRFAFNFDVFQEEIDLRERFGFRSPIVLSISTGGVYQKYMGESYGSHLRNIKTPPAEFFDEIEGMVREIEAERSRRRWPEFLYYPVDEPSRDDVAVQFMVGVLKAIRRVPGARTYVTADPTHPEFEPMRPYVDIWCTQPFLPDYETVTAEMRNGDVEYWCYPNHINGENDHTPVAGARMTYGFGFWRSGFKVLIPWIYQASYGDPFNYLDGPTMDFFNRSEADGTPIPVILWEAYREGYDDYRYVYTLQRMITEAEGLPGQDARDAVKRARETLDTIWHSIHVRPKYKYEGLWSPHEFDAYRWLIAQEILALKELADL